MIERKDHVPEKHRTPSRDAVADYIEEYIINEGRWPMAKTAISDELGSDERAAHIEHDSRQHVSNVIDHYFEETGKEGHTDSSKVVIDIEVPPDCERESYLRGFVHGHEQALQ